MNEMLKKVESLSVEAGKILMNHYERVHQIEYKDLKDIVTEADVASETFLKQALHEAFPNYGFVGEETGESGSQLEGRFIVDPLDGTINFSRGIPLFAVSIGIEQHGRIVGGVIHAPALQTTWTAFEGLGAFCNGKKIHVSTTNDLVRALCYANDFNVGKDKQEALNDEKIKRIQQVASQVQRFRCIGSAAIELAWVAQGSIESYYANPAYYWDWAAGSALIHEAGGTFTQINGKPVDGTSVAILGTNGKLHETFISRLNQ